jgi:glycosyltransferase involved in cell wall biosynthesis
MTTWFDADVIEATVKNALLQGCEEVYVLDNDSPDHTVKIARSAGATIERVYATKYFDDVLKTRLMNETVRNISEELGEDHIWWLYLDSDEFHHGPYGLTLRQYLSRLDISFRVVGVSAFDHFPHTLPEYEPGRHPLDFQPLCAARPLPSLFDICWLHHWKHPLVRWDRGTQPIVPSVGFHRVKADFQLLEPRQGVFMHHFQYREESVTRRRLEAACASPLNGADPPRIALYDERVGGASDVTRRWRNLDAVYGHRWPEVDHQGSPGVPLGVKPRPWTELVAKAHTEVLRWYPTR